MRCLGLVGSTAIEVSLCGPAIDSVSVLTLAAVEPPVPSAPDVAGGPGSRGLLTGGRKSLLRSLKEVGKSPDNRLRVSSASRSGRARCGALRIRRVTGSWANALRIQECIVIANSSSRKWKTDRRLWRFEGT